MFRKLYRTPLEETFEKKSLIIHAKISKWVLLLLSFSLLFAVQRTSCGSKALLKCVCNGEDLHYLLYFCMSSGLSCFRREGWAHAGWCLLQRLQLSTSTAWHGVLFSVLPGSQVASTLIVFSCVSIKKGTVLYKMYLE